MSYPTSPVGDTPALGAIDLEALRRRLDVAGTYDHDRPFDFQKDALTLIAAVEALRERVAEMLPYEKSCLKITAWCAEHGRSEITTETELLEAIEAAEARVVESEKQTWKMQRKLPYR